MDEYFKKREKYFNESVKNAEKYKKLLSNSDKGVEVDLPMMFVTDNGHLVDIQKLIQKFKKIMAVESKKILPVIEKYLLGKGIEIGCGDETIIDGVFGVDGRDFPCVNFLTDNLYDLPKQLPDHVGKYDFLVSSHTAEHLPDMYRTVYEWSQFVKSGGYFILYLPNSGDYNNYDNPEHFWDTEYKSFMFWFEQTFCGKGRNFKGEQYATPIFETVESGLDIEKENHYSFYCVFKKV